MRLFKILIILNVFTLVSCLETSPPKEGARLALSLDTLDTVGSEANGVTDISGKELPGLRFNKKEMKTLESNSSFLEQAYIQYPDSLEILMEYARSLDKKGAFIAARNLYSIGARKHPQSAAVFQYKGLNEIITRDFKLAIKDLQTAVFFNREKKPVNDPYLNVNFMKSSDHFYTWYYLGMAFYFNRNYDSAISSFKKCLSYTKNDDDLTVIPYFWLYIIYQEIGNPQVAESFLETIDTNMLIVKSKDYYRGLLLFKGIFKPDRLTKFTIDKSNRVSQPIQAYALVKWYNFNGLYNEAANLSQLLQQSNSWDNLGFIAGEVDNFTNDNLN